ncbi:hypothetical protein V6N13_012689 [Hibiscus sabdariffa]|uniref:Uncharacterized protein n=2 Tax=Hibiscus sabdariffa TaxID=183260 RepID=A0ABR2SGS3_9ROSI
MQTVEQSIFIVSYCRELDFLSHKLQVIPIIQKPLQQAPDPSLVKVNFDASFFSVDKSFWPGVVVCNSAWEIMRACRHFTSYVASAFMGEAYAALHSVHLMADLGLDSTIIEGDSSTVVKKLQASSSDLSELSSLIFDVQARAKTMRKCLFNFTPCASNQVAYIIAEDFSLNSGDRLSVEEILSSILRAAASDRCTCIHLRLILQGLVL